MQVFNDNKGEPWEVGLDYDTMRRIEADTRMDLTSALPGPLQVQQFQSPVQLLQSSILVRLNVLWSICRVQADSKGIKRHLWEARMRPAVDPATSTPAGRSPLADALECLNKELIDFFRLNGCENEAAFVEDMQIPWSQSAPSKSATNSPE